MSALAPAGPARLEAVRLATDTRLHPWLDPVGAAPVLEHTLAEAQQDALDTLGIPLVATPSGRCGVVLFTDRQWFTAAALRRLLDAGPGRLRIIDAEFWATTGSLQRVDDPQTMELGWSAGPVEATVDGLRGLAPVEVALGLEDHGVRTEHPRLRHAHRPLRVGAASVHLVQHWSHLVRVNQLAIQAEAYAARDRFAEASAWRRTIQAARMVWRAGGVTEAKVGAALTTTGQDCVIHPTAVVEASRLGSGVCIGPYAVVRGSVLQDGVVLDEHTTVISSVLARGARLGPYGHLRFSTLWPGARVSAGPGYQLCAFGRDCFVAWGVAALDLSFGRSIRAESAPGVVVDTGHHFLGCAVGHRAVVGQGVRLAPGAVVPSDTTLVADAQSLYRRWGDHPSSTDPVVVDAGGVRSVRRSADASRGSQHGLGRGGEDALLGDDASDETRGGDVEGEVPGG